MPKEALPEGWPPLEFHDNHIALNPRRTDPKEYSRKNTKKIFW